MVQKKASKLVANFERRHPRHEHRKNPEDDDPMAFPPFFVIEIQAHRATEFTNWKRRTSFCSGSGLGDLDWAPEVRRFLRGDYHAETFESIVQIRMNLPFNLRGRNELGQGR